ncbi:MAG: alkaline phosphatase family protein, partial [Melioribacteraceae bacterium]|nr:alkaline phosphatase family protein [Melioribacteraceae bacterium]
MKTKLFFLCIIIAPIILLSQKEKDIKLVVGIVVDQMRYDYLERYYNEFGENGFRRLINEGTNFTNCRINYIPTVTGAGHASIYTGTSPYYHGIVANDWKDRNTIEDINCCSSINPPDEILPDGISKNRSPEQLLSTTIGDQLKLSNNGQSKVISVSLKDRGAILPAGQSADGAFWFNDDTGKFISSFYYYDKLPEWVNVFNNSGKIESYLNKEWSLFKDKDAYSGLPEDNSPYEQDVFSEDRTSFPHSLKNVNEDEVYEKLVHTPLGDQIIMDFVKDAIINESLGKRDFTDHLAISFSSPDKIGHEYGPQSYEVMDTYLILDNQIAQLLS